LADTPDLTPKMSPDKFPLISLTLQFRTLAELKTISSQLSDLIALGTATEKVASIYPTLVETTQTFYEKLSKETYQELLIEAYKTFGE
jgi:hypothetical protein